jgi:hypothetical protein
MSKTKKSIWSRFTDLLSGGDIQREVPPIPPSTNSNHALFDRLMTEGRTSGHTRRVRSDVLQGTKLADEVIWLMFNLQKPSGANWQTTNALVDALNHRTLVTTTRVFYIYVDESSPIPSGDTISDMFYERLADLSQQSTSLFNFLNDRFSLQQQQTRTRAATDFNPADPDQRQLLINLLRCQFSVCRKSFPPQGIDHIFIVGRMPLHDVVEIERLRFKQQIRATSSNNQDQPVEIYLAVTVKAAGRYEDHSLRFNAHRFGKRDDNSPQREYNLYIGNWRTDWEFSIGAAEHDEIQHSSMADTGAKVKLNNLQINGARWNYQPSNTLIPSWLTIHHNDATRVTGEGIRLCFVRPPVLDNPLSNVLDRRQFRQEISLIGRVLPYSQGQLQQFHEVTDHGFRAAVKLLKVAAAIEVRNSVWLVNTEDKGVFRVFQNERNQWEAAGLENGATFQSDETEYRWNATGKNIYPERFVGALTIYPSPREVLGYKKQLNVDKDAEGFLVAHNREFSGAINPDLTLGHSGVVRIKCVEVTDDGRGKYVLIPVQEEPLPTNPFFAFQPVYPREKGWPQGKAWLTYENESTDDLQRDEQSGEARYEGQRILAEEHSYHLISGTSFFQLKVSGTPWIGTASSSPRPSATDEVSPVQPQGQVSGEFTPTPLNIQIRLMGTRWSNYEIQEADQSNFAVHFRLMNKSAPMYFLKAYFPHSVGSATRESAFYERYTGEESALFLCRPHILRVHDDDPRPAPWALVFPLLDSYEKYFPTSSQATITQAAAVGFGMATLLSRTANDGMINFDVDVTQLCFDSNGRLVIVDFDNTFPILRDPNDQAQVTPLLSILREGRLPAKNPWLPPEAHAFGRTFSPEDRMRSLASIGAPFSTYMLAVILLQLLKAETTNEPGYLTLFTGTIARRSVQEGLKLKDIEAFEDLLREMLKPSGADRPALADVVTRLQNAIRTFSASSETAEADAAKLLGRVP